MIIYAINVHSGGGKVLLDELIEFKTFGNPEILFLDSRYVFPGGVNEESFKVFRIKPNLISRIMAEFKLRKISKNRQGYILAFGNMPPAFRMQIKTVVYLQNAFVLPSSPLPQDSIKVKARCMFEKIWFKLFKKNVDEFWVQTKWMRDSMCNSVKQSTIVLPFLPHFPVFDNKNKSIDFLTVTSSQRHKNLINFLKGAIESRLRNVKFVIVTDSTNSKIDQLINQMKINGQDVRIYTKASRRETLSLMNSSRYVVITSTIESFCLPLHEALHYNANIISGNFSFILEYTKPSFTINPLDSSTIAEALRCAAVLGDSMGGKEN